MVVAVVVAKVWLLWGCYGVAMVVAMVVLQMLNAHSHPVTVLMFSEDGKLLATYAYGDSTLSVWQVSICDVMLIRDHMTVT